MSLHPAYRNGNSCLMLLRQRFLCHVGWHPQDMNPSSQCSGQASCHREITRTEFEWLFSGLLGIKEERLGG